MYKYLQSWLIHFYPERPEIVKQLEQLATTLGGHLEVPQLRRKYVWIQRIFGFVLAKQAQFWLPRLKWSLLRPLDKALFRMENRTLRYIGDLKSFGERSM
jgi:hypothetical protein